jgi:hypothetical protein
MGKFYRETSNSLKTDSQQSGNGQETRLKGLDIRTTISYPTMQCNVVESRW